MVHCVYCWSFGVKTVCKKFTRLHVPSPSAKIKNFLGRSTGLMAFMLTTQPLSTPLSPHSGGGNPSAQTRPLSRPSVARPVPHISERVFALWEHRLNIGVARILSGGALFCQQVDALKHGLNLPQNLSHVAKTVLKIDSCSGWGCTSCPGDPLIYFPVN